MKEFNIKEISEFLNKNPEATYDDVFNFLEIPIEHRTDYIGGCIYHNVIKFREEKLMEELENERNR